MTAYRLMPPEGTTTFWKIVQGRKWVGRVVPMGDGSGYLGIVNVARGPRAEFRGATPTEAFEGVVARRLGYASAAALHASNAAVRRENRAARAAQQERIRPAKDALARGDYAEFFRQLDAAADRDFRRIERAGEKE